MLKLLPEYRSYLEEYCRFDEKTVAHYLGQLPFAIESMQIESVQDLQPRNVARAWQVHRWREFDRGIVESEEATGGYLIALKEFLRYLEERGYPVTPGIANIIPLVTPSSCRCRGLSQFELQKLQKHLVFHVSNDCQRRTTALVHLLLGTGASLEEVLATRIGESQILPSDKTDNSCGDFHVRDGQVFLQIRESIGRSREIPLSEDAVTFVNFYLENRPVESPFLFARLSRTGLPKRWPIGSARRAVQRLLREAGLQLRPEQALLVLGSTVLPDNLRTASVPASIPELLKASQSSATQEMPNTGDAFDTRRQVA